MSRYAAGDAEAFEELFARYEPRAYAYFFKRTACRERAQDLYQELFLRIHGARHRYDPSRPFAPWLFQIAHRLLIDDSRRAFRHREVGMEGSEPSDAPGAAEERAGSAELLARSLARLSPAERYVVLSTKLRGEGYDELSRRMGRSVDALKKMASRAILRLREAGPESPLEAGES